MLSSTLDDLLERYTRVSTANRAMLDRFCDIAHAFQARDIPFVLLKGGDVISRLYGVRGTRPLSDVDLLVHEKDVPAIDEVLNQAGFRQQIDGNPSYVSSDGLLSLDITTGLWYLGRPELTALWSRTIRRAWPPLDTACLAAEDLLIHVVAYAVLHRGHVSASLAQDVRLLLEKETVHWPIVIERVRQHGLQLPFHYGLTYVRKTYPSLDIPPDVREALRPGNRTERIFYRFFACVVTPEPIPDIGHLLTWATRPDKFGWLRGTLFPTDTFLSYRYGAGSCRSPWITRVKRICHLAGAALRLAHNVLRSILKPARRT